MTVLWQYEQKAREAQGVANRPPLERYAKGRLELRRRLAMAARSALRPPPVLSLSAWADRYAYLSPETSSESGKFRAFAYQIGMMDAVTNPDVERITVMKSARIGYALALDTLLPTPSGWTTMGAVSVGDCLIDEAGKPCLVTCKSAVFREHECYTVRFDDGTEIVADAGHRWKIEADQSFEYLRGERGQGRIGRPKPGDIATRTGLATTAELARMLRTSRGRTSLAIANAAPLELPHADLPIPAYTLGLWLGDGHLVTPRVTQHRPDADEVCSYVTAEGVAANVRYIDERYPNNATVFLGSSGGRLERSPWAQKFRQFGLLTKKHVPEIYLRASTKQRLELLRGLMDSDGTIDGTSGRVEFCNTNKELADAVDEIACSLGMKVFRSIRYPRKSGHLLLYRVGFRADPDQTPFRLQRKADKVLALAKPSINRRRRILSVEPCESVSVQCVSVDAPSSLFLCGRSMIPTHNTKVLDHICGYFVHQDPSPVLIVQPRVEDAQDYSRSEIMPMLRDTPALKSLVGEVKAHDPNQRILKRMFPNGASLSFVGANSPGGFRRITARVILFDEIDGYSIEGAGKEGDQIALATTRSQTFWNRKIVLGSTPTIRGMSLIERSFEQSDKRFYYVPCPQCGSMQTLKWANLRWDRTPEGAHLPETAHFVCVENGCIIEERDKRQMIGAGEWRATAPFKGHAGFHIWAAYSLWPNASWRNLVREFLSVKKDPVALRTFVNTVWGETWEDTVERVEGHSLLARCEAYGPDSLPIDVRFLSAGVDTQGDRLELQVIGWGAGEESWVVDYEILLGDPAQPQIWADLDGLLLRPYHNETGRELRIQATCIDMFGHHGNQVLQFCDARRARLVLPIGGAPGTRPIWPKRATETKTHSRVYMVGVDTAKDVVYGRLKITQKGPGFIHFPAHEAINQKYFDQLTAEHVITKYRFGRPYRKWELPSGKRNEALDTFAYALAARMSRPVRLTDAVPHPQVPPAVEEIREVEQAGTNEGMHSLVDEINPPQQQYARPAIRHSEFEKGGWMGGRRERGWFDRD